eukprot:1157366-Pelagomonas_calceolata.AAC.7
MDKARQEDLHSKKNSTRHAGRVSAVGQLPFASLTAVMQGLPEYQGTLPSFLRDTLNAPSPTHETPQEMHDSLAWSVQARLSYALKAQAGGTGTKVSKKGPAKANLTVTAGKEGTGHIENPGKDFY